MFSFFSKFFKKSINTVEDAANAVGDMAEKSVSAVVDTAVSIGNAAGKAVETTGNVIYQGVEIITSSLINTTKFLADSEYRRKEGYPWLKSIIRDNWKKVKQELDESHDMLLVLWKYSKGYNLAEEEKKAAKEQLGDIIKTVPALGIFLLPGGAILLPLLAKALPWDLMPSSFKEKIKEEYGEDSLNTELKPEEEIPLDKEAEIPENVKKEVEEKMRNIVISDAEGEEDSKN